MYYLSRKQNPAALQALINFLKIKFKEHARSRLSK